MKTTIELPDELFERARGVEGHPRRAHGVTEPWSAGRDFGRYPALVVRNPLVG